MPTRIMGVVELGSCQSEPSLSLYRNRICMRQEPPESRYQMTSTSPDFDSTEVMA